MGVTYRGVHSDEFGLVVRTNPMILPEHENTLIPIPGMHGAHDGGTQYDVGRIPLEISFIANDIYDYSERLRRLANWLRPDEGVGEYVADHEPDKTYFAKLASTSMSRIELISRMGEGTIELICPDPFAYGSERTFDISDAVIPNEGTAETYPTFDLTVKKETTLLSIGNESNQNEAGEPLSVYLGTETEVDEETEEDRRLVLHDSMQSTSGWVGASNVDNGKVTGQMGVDQDGFYVESWGDDGEEDLSNEWIGPSLQREIDEELNSFIVDLDISNQNEYNENGEKVRGGVGIIEVYLRDINDNMICKYQFGDTSDVEAINHGVFAIRNGRFKIKYRRNRKELNNFNGRISVMRDSSYFYPLLAKKKNGTLGDWYETDPYQIVPSAYGDIGAADNPVKKIQIALRKWGGAKRIKMRVHETKIWSIVGEYETEKKVVHKFKPGDKVHIDTRTGLVTLNGEERTDLIMFGNDFFTLVEGINRLDVDTDVLEGTVTYRNRYL